jgi:hypothetical protein
MFEGLKNLTNIAYLFAYMKDIKYVLKGNGFKDCALINVNSAFAETSANNNINGNKEGCIPYGLFLQEQEASFTTVSGLTAEDAEELGIVDETYGIINCQFDSEGKVIVRFDNEGNVISGATYPDGTQIQHVINDKGIVLDGTNGTEEVFAEEYYPLPVAMTTHGGKYKTHKTTITNIHLMCFSLQKI